MYLQNSWIPRILSDSGLFYEGTSHFLENHQFENVGKISFSISELQLDQPAKFELADCVPSPKGISKLSRSFPAAERILKDTKCLKTKETAAMMLVFHSGYKYLMFIFNFPLKFSTYYVIVQREKGIPRIPCGL